MATIYSLICWGGKDGKNLTTPYANASTEVFTMANHGLRNGTGIVPTTAFDGLTQDLPYYARIIDANTFYLYDTYAHAIDTGSTTGRVNVTGTTTGTFKSKYYVDLSDKARWTSAVPTERIYAGIKAWRDARYAATSGDAVGVNDVETAEIAEAFTEYGTAAIVFNLPCAAQVVTATVNGVDSGAYHNGVFGEGYILDGGSVHYVTWFTISAYNTVIDGLQIYRTGLAYDVFLIGVTVTGNKATLQRNLLNGGTIGISLRGVGNEVHHNIVINSTYGIYLLGYGSLASRVYNNLTTKCTTGMYDETYDVKGFYFNNISVGNTTNWSTKSSTIEGAAYNLGESGNTPWNVGAATAITTGTTAMFNNHTNNDFTSAATSSAQVDSGMTIFDSYTFDLKGVFTPAYRIATYPSDVQDIGPFERTWDSADGRPPATVTISLTGMANGSEMAIYKTSDMSEIAAPQSTTGTYTASYTYTADTGITIRVRKGTSGTKYLPYETTGTITANGFALNIVQIVDTIAV